MNSRRSITLANLVRFLITRGGGQAMQMAFIRLTALRRQLWLRFSTLRRLAGLVRVQDHEAREPGSE